MIINIFYVEDHIIHLETLRCKDNSEKVSALKEMKAMEISRRAAELLSSDPSTVDDREFDQSWICEEKPSGE
jgi:hypothetical protein